MFPYLEEDSAGSYGMSGFIQFVMYKVIIWAMSWDNGIRPL